MDNTNKSDDTSKQLAISYERIAMFLIWSGLFLIIIITAIYSFTNILPEFKDLFGEYGEYIGGLVGSLWALAGVTLFYEALRFQRTELRMQRHELELQRHEIIEQTEQSKRQNEMIEVQTFESTFFNLLSLHTEIVETIELEVRDYENESEEAAKKYTGRDCFVEYYQIFKKVFNFSFEKVTPEDFTPDSMKLLVEYSFRVFFEEHQANLGHYFRTLFTLFNFIDQSNLKNKEFYISLSLSQLSNYELVLLYFHGLSDKNKAFKPIIEKYSLLYQVPEDELVDITRDIYDEKAFGIYKEE